MRAIVFLIVAALATPAFAQVPHGEIDVGPRILGEPAFAFEMDALSQAEVTRPGWPVITTRASPCMSYDGTTWHTQPANTACVGRWGLESFGSVTNYVTDSAQPATWTPVNGPNVQVQPDGGVLVTDDSPAAYEGLKRTVTIATGEYMLGSAYVRATSGGSKIRLLSVNSSISDLSCGTSSPSVSATPFSGACFFVVPDDGNVHRIWARGTTAAASSDAGITIYVGSVEQGAAETGSFIIYQGQGEKSVTSPGPRHDCAGSPCTRAADVHTVSTAGWPVDRIDIRLQYTPLDATPVGEEYLLDTRAVGGSDGLTLRRMPDGRLSAFIQGSASAFFSAIQAWTGGQPSTIRLVVVGASITLYRDGVTLFTSTASAPLTGHGPNAWIGSVRGGSLQAQGSIRLLRVSQ